MPTSCKRCVLPILLSVCSHLVAQTGIVPSRPVLFQNERFLAADFAPGIHAGFAVHDKNGKLLFDDLVRIPQASSVQIFAITASPGGGVAVSGMAWDRPGSGTPFIAIYSESISLQNVVRTRDFLPRSIIYSSDGRLFAFGPERDQQGKWLVSGHCLRVFNAEGGEISRGLPRSKICQDDRCFPFEDVPVVAAGRKCIVLYVPEVNRIFRFSIGTGDFTSIEGLDIWKKRKPAAITAFGNDAYVVHHKEAKGNGGIGVVSLVDSESKLNRVPLERSVLTSPLNTLIGGDGERLLVYLSPEKEYVWVSELK